MAIEVAKGCVEVAENGGASSATISGGGGSLNDTSNTPEIIGP